MKSISKRLKISAAVQRIIQDASQLWKQHAALPVDQVDQLTLQLDQFSETAIYAVYLTIPNQQIKDALRMFISHWRFIKPKTTGVDLRKLGIPPGPVYKDILEALRSAWLTGAVKSPGEEQTLLKQLLPKTLPEKK